MHVHANCAVSLDGRLAHRDGSPLLLSGDADLARVHRLRAEVDAVLVGVGTVLSDDPSLLVKEAYAGPVTRQPARVVVDTRLSLPRDARVLDGRAPCLVLTAAHGDVDGAKVLRVKGRERVDLADGLRALATEGMQRVLVEGGGRILSSFLAAGLVNALTVYVAPVFVGPGAPGLGDGWPRGEGAHLGLRLTAVETFDAGALLTFQKHRGRSA